ncbi:hypothetical protein HAX54_024482, partial [Datura stramonium]|nr:hypothetical protein [Datura stramonium]
PQDQQRSQEKKSFLQEPQCTGSRPPCQLCMSESLTKLAGAQTFGLPMCMSLDDWNKGGILSSILVPSTGFGLLLGFISLVVSMECSFFFFVAVSSVQACCVWRVRQAAQAFCPCMLAVPTCGIALPWMPNVGSL